MSRNLYLYMAHAMHKPVSSYFIEWLWPDDIIRPSSPTRALNSAENVEVAFLYGAYSPAEGFWIDSNGKHEN